jgi:hypothetical protein
VHLLSNDRLSVTPRTLCVLVRHAVKEVACEGPGTCSDDVAVAYEGS